MVDQMMESSKTWLPGVNMTPRHIETADEPLTAVEIAAALREEALRANEECEKWSSNNKRITSNYELLTRNLAINQ
jgi:hypothetical protein